MVDILNAVLTDSLAAVEAACAEALTEAVYSADVVHTILARRREYGLTITTPDALRLCCRAGGRLRALRPPQEGHLMERSEILATMGGLKLFGMKAAYDEIVARAVKRQHEPQRIVGDLLAAELSEKQARSMKYQLTVARLPFAKEVDEFVFTATPVNESLVRDLAGGGFLAHQRNLVLVGGTEPAS
jgi:hypothetical protein